MKKHDVENCPRCGSPPINKKRWWCGTRKVNKKDLDPLLDDITAQYISWSNVCSDNMLIKK